MLINLPLFGEHFFQKLHIHRHLRQNINERNINMQIFRNSKKLPKLSIKFGLGKSLWERQRWHIRLWGRGLRFLRYLTFTFLLELILTRQDILTHIESILSHPPKL